MKTTMGILVAGLLLLGCDQGQEAGQPVPGAEAPGEEMSRGAEGAEQMHTASAALAPVGAGEVKGNLSFTSTGGAEGAKVTGTLTGLQPGEYKLRLDKGTSCADVTSAAATAPAAGAEGAEGAEGERGLDRMGEPDPAAPAGGDRAGAEGAAGRGSDALGMGGRGQQKDLATLKVEQDGMLRIDETVRGLEWEGDESMMGRIVTLVPANMTGDQVQPLACGVVREGGATQQPSTEPRG